MVVGYGLFFVYAIAITHLLRRIIARRRWFTLPLGALALRLAGATVVLGAVLTTCVTLVTFVQSGARSVFIQPGNLVLLAVNLTFAAALWTILYVSLSSWLRHRQARQQAEALERSLGAARLKALEAQLSPHFLFNSLNGLRGMIAENPAHAQDMVTRLANILRHNLTRGADTTTETLADQLEIVNDYLELERVRFDERLRTRLDIDPATWGCALPAMLLQTLVENAIKHGIALLPAGGELNIISRRIDGFLELTVENSGTLRTAPAGSTQVGLANARERLRMLHGERASLELRASSPDRVQAIVRLPVSAPAAPRPGELPSRSDDTPVAGSCMAGDRSVAAPAPPFPDMTDANPAPLSLDAQFAAFTRNRFLAMPVTGAFVWLAIGICGLFLPTPQAALAMFIGTGMIFYLALAVAKLLGEDLLGRKRKGNRFDRVFLASLAMAGCVYALAIPFFLIEPTSLPLSVGILTGLMWIPFSALIRHWVGYLHGFTRTAMIVAAWYLFPAQRFVMIPAVIVAVYFVSIIALQRRWVALHS